MEINIQQHAHSLLTALLDVFLHKLFVELVSEAVVDELWVLVVWLGAAAVLEDHVVVPTSLDLHVRLGRVCVLVLQQGVAGQNVFLPDPFLFLPLFKFL